MSEAAYHGLPIAQTIAAGFISYRYRKWEKTGTQTCTSRDEDGGCNNYVDDYAWKEYPQNSNAVDMGTVFASSSVHVNGKAVATTSSTTNESWTNTGFESELVSASPSTDGIGTGAVTSGSSTIFVNGSPVAFNGSKVTTCVGTVSSIQGGSSNVFVGS
ncbi:hypothetical protein BC351_10295 [Paenibacillus ferrarius]|uniref:Uncharacterized protein n=1 Tax=Paenibacillus ferrarius TaxID=1469647 RepID=A0A1V4H8T7_9BACL|nr:hypothetical protein [Paenibacillus ferrarius]OPH47573.1 hypothetical protein BC351_10295 [Paenibacillus ferrarius]